MLKAPNDRRAIRTEKLLRNALSELIEEKGFNDISITDLTSRADINRGTFYLHYTDKHDLLNQVENEFMQEIQIQTNNSSYINLLDSDSRNEAIIPFLLKLFEYFKENAQFIKAILGPNGDPLFQTKLKNFIESNLFQKNNANPLLTENTMVPKEYFVTYILSALIGVVQHWLEGSMEQSPEDMALTISKLFLFTPMKTL